MNQPEVLKFLTRNKGWFTSREIADRLGQGIGSISTGLFKIITRRRQSFSTITTGAGVRADTIGKISGSLFRISLGKLPVPSTATTQIQTSVSLASAQASLCSFDIL